MSNTHTQLYDSEVLNEFRSWAVDAMSKYWIKMKIPRSVYIETLRLGEPRLAFEWETKDYLGVVRCITGYNHRYEVWQDSANEWSALSPMQLSLVKDCKSKDEAIAACNEHAIIEYYKTIIDKAKHHESI